MYPKNTGTSPAPPTRLLPSPWAANMRVRKSSSIAVMKGALLPSRIFAPIVAPLFRWATSRMATLVCGYHGLVISCDGKTVEMPTGQRVRGSNTVQQDLRVARALRFDLGLA